MSRLRPVQPLLSINRPPAIVDYNLHGIGNRTAGTLVCCDKALSSFPKKIALLAAVCGLLMSTLPYLCWYATTHSGIWLADADEIQYTLIASHAYHWHPLYLSDPTFVHGSQSVYSWVQLVPAELICKTLGLAPIRFGLILRILGGLAIGWGWYAVVWQHVRRTWAAFFAALFLITDCGWLLTRPVVRQWSIAASVAFHRAGDIFAHNPSIYRDWRIISPVVVLPFLLLYLWMLRAAIDEPSKTRIACSGIAFGILFLAYFYYWTAAGFALVLGLIVDRARWRVYFHTGWIGAVVGSPELARMLLARNHQGSEWMQRFDEFVRIPHLSEHGHFILSGLLVVFTFALVWRCFRSLLYLWCLCASGFLMIHEQLFSGLQLENYHWAHLFSPCMILLLIFLLLNGLERLGARRNMVAGVVAAGVLFNAGLGVYLRGQEALHTADSRRYSLGYVDYERQHDEYPRLEAGAVTGGTDDFVQYAMIVDHVSPLGSAYPVMLSPSVTDSELDRRYAMNSYLAGESRAAFEAEQQQLLDHLQYGVELRDLERRRERLASRLMWFDRIAADPKAAIDSYQIRYFGLPAGTPKPATLGPDWVLLQDGPAWEVWGHQPAGEIHVATGS